LILLHGGDKKPHQKVSKIVRKKKARGCGDEVGPAKLLQIAKSVFSS